MNKEKDKILLLFSLDNGVVVIMNGNVSILSIILKMFEINNRLLNQKAHHGSSSSKKIISIEFLVYFHLHIMSGAKINFRIYYSLSNCFHNYFLFNLSFCNK